MSRSVSGVKGGEDRELWGRSDLGLEGWGSVPEEPPAICRKLIMLK